MAVAVKSSQGARSTGPGASAAILSVVGVFYLLACLVIVFSLIPSLFWSAWNGAGLTGYSFVGGSLLGIIGLAVGVMLLVLGARLLGPNPPVGVRAGVFVGFIGLLLVVLLTRWVSLWAEHWTYQGSLSPTGGLILTVAVGAALLVGWLVAFFLPGKQKFIVALEQAGWFHANSYKSNQGQKVRRGTVIGLLLLVGAGIYTMVSHNILGGRAPDWTINIPFTGKMAIESYGDTRTLIADDKNLAKNMVEIRWPGEPPVWPKGEPVPFDRYKAEVDRIVLGQPELAEALAGVTEPTAYLLAVNEKILGKQMQTLIDQKKTFTPGETRRLEAKFNTTPWEDVGDAAWEFFRAGQAVDRQNPLAVVGKAFAVPAGVLLLDRYEVRAINDQTAEGKNVKVVFKGDSTFQEGQVVSAKDFDAEVTRIEDEKKAGRDRVVPTKTALAPATGRTEYKSLTLLPSVQFTVPLLLMAASLWLAWRVVNMPAFADFLIATEAELNKVSWTTQRKLVQDTIVVLVTVFLMAVFLFGMDWTWKVVLSSGPIGVLHIPEEDGQQTKTFENKKF